VTTGTHTPAIDPFNRDRASWLRQVRRDNDLSAKAYRVASELAEHFNRIDRSAYPGVDLLAEKSGLGARQTQRLIGNLKQRGHLRIEVGGGRAQTNRYFWIIKAVAAENERAARARPQAIKTVTEMSPFSASKPRQDCRSVEGETVTVPTRNGDISGAETVTVLSPEPCEENLVREPLSSSSVPPSPPSPRASPVGGDDDDARIFSILSEIFPARLPAALAGAPAVIRGWIAQGCDPERHIWPELRDVAGALRPPLKNFRELARHRVTSQVLARRDAPPNLRLVSNQRSMVFVLEDSPQWAACAKRQREEKGKPPVARSSMHAGNGERGFYFPADWPEAGVTAFQAPPARGASAMRPPLQPNSFIRAALRAQQRLADEENGRRPRSSPPATNQFLQAAIRSQLEADERRTIGEAQS
jgi:hypothetical protein